MIELYILNQLVTYVKCGTLSEAADKLHLSQPALSRNMRKLEDDIGVTLFTRHRNKIELNENGKLLTELAENLLFEAESVIQRVQAFDESNNTIAVGLCAPAPVWRLTPMITGLYPAMKVQTEIVDEAELLIGLENNRFGLIVLPHDISGEYFSVPFEKENLLLSVPKGHRFADRASVAFSEIDGENVLLYSELGFWHDIHTSKMPNSRAITQSDRYGFSELVNASNLLSFNSDLVKKYADFKTDRVDIPITDEEAQVTYYLICKTEDKSKYKALFQSLK